MHIHPYLYIHAELNTHTHQLIMFAGFMDTLLIFFVGFFANKSQPITAYHRRMKAYAQQIPAPTQKNNSVLLHCHTCPWIFKIMFKSVLLLVFERRL